MKKIVFSFSLSILTCFHFFNLDAASSKSPAIVENGPAKAAANEDMAVFTPPAGWYLADAKAVQLPPKVKVMVIGKGSYASPPSMNLSLEPFQGTLKQYLQIVKRLNDDRGYDWKDLGSIPTQAGRASLSQVDTKSQWGDNRQMHAILLKNGIIYILTASAMKDEFSLFYQDFFKAMKSLRIANDFYGIIPDAKQKNELKALIQKVKMQWKNTYSQMHSETGQNNSSDFKEQVFSSDSFQTSIWQPFKETLNRQYADLGTEWQKMVEKKVKDELFALSEENSNDSTSTGLKESKLIN